MKKILLRNLCLLNLFASVLFPFISNAQIVYTNIKDKSYTCNKKCGICYDYRDSLTYPLDLNNDGSPDFNITAYRAVTHYDGCTSCYCLDEIVNHVSITALNDNGVVIGPSGTALISGSKISSLSEWSTELTGNIILRSVYWGGHTSEWWHCALLNEGDWPNSTDRYLGLRIVSAGQIYYGWARLSLFVDKSGASFKIKDYAYESAPDRSINAGQTGAGIMIAPAITFTSVEQSESTKLLVVPNPTSSSSTISFSLQRQEKVSLKIFDINGRLINTLADREFSGGNHQVILNAKELSSGIYIIRMQTLHTVQTGKLVVVK